MNSPGIIKKTILWAAAAAILTGTALARIGAQASTSSAGTINRSLISQDTERCENDLLSLLHSLQERMRTKGKMQAVDTLQDTLDALLDARHKVKAMTALINNEKLFESIDFRSKLKHPDCDMYMRKRIKDLPAEPFH